MAKGNTAALAAMQAALAKGDKAGAKKAADGLDKSTVDRLIRKAVSRNN